MPVRGVAAVMVGLVALTGTACDRLPYGVPAGLTCLQLDAVLCQQKAAEMGLGQDPTIVRMELQCTALRCTPVQGELRVTIWNADGATSEGEMGWDDPDVGGGAVPGSPPSVGPAAP